MTTHWLRSGPLLLAVLGPLVPALAVEAAHGSPGRALISLEATVNRTSLWSSLREGNLCSNGGACIVPMGATWVLDAPMDVETLTVEGTLRWDTSKDGLEIRAQYIYVTGHGRFEIGSVDAPMMNKATIHIKKGGESNHEWGYRFFSGDQFAEIEIHGRPLARTWTLLSQTAPQRSMELHLKHDPQAMGWRVGDRIGIATTSRGHSTVHTIAGLGPHLVQLETPLPNEHWGGWRQVLDQRFEMAAEVMNLERSVLITGDHDDFYETKLGLHTSIHGQGYADIRYTRVEYCGQRDVLGRYCLHFHMMGHCPRCVFKGNAIHDSQQVGITIHGAHFTTVEENTIFDARGVGIYTEDGNEMNNTIARNVMVCSWYERCSEHWLGQPIFAGIYLIGMTNDLIENRVAGYENGIWTAGSFRGLGQGAATNRVCPQYTPFGIIRDNVNHDCWRFGMYPDNQYPRNLKRDADGFLTDKSSCNSLTVDGRDNGVTPANVIANELDWHCMFVGQYAMGDVQYYNYTGVNNAHSMYWKASKNFADGRINHITDSRFYNDPSDGIGLGKLDMMGPAGPFTFGIANTVFAGGPAVTGVVIAGQACGLGGAGGPCNVQYLLHNVDFSRVQVGRPLVSFGIHCVDQGYVLPMFVANDNSLGGYRSIVSKHMDGFANIPGCQHAGYVYGNGIGCNRPVRRLNIWGRRSDPVTLSGPGYDTPPKDSAPVDGMNAGKLQYEPTNGHGYGTPVIVGETYTLQGSWSGDMVVDFSDPHLANYFGTPHESVTLQLGGASCQLHASDDRSWLMPHSLVRRIVSTHTSIQGGNLLCGGLGGYSIGGGGGPRLGPPQGFACSRLSSVKHACRVKEDGCLVLAGGLAGRTCTDYCAHGSLVCAGAWQQGAKDCSKAKSLGCDEVSDEPGDDDLLCECDQPETTIAPSTTAPPWTTVRLTRFPECTSLVNVTARCGDDECKVLARGMEGRSCSQYCKTSRLECTGAWEPDDGCNAREEIACGEVRGDLSHLICECALGGPPTSTTATTTTKEEHAGRATYQIRSMQRGLCLLERGEGEDSLTLIKCDHMVTGQQWTAVRSGEAALIRSVRGFCLEERSGKAVVARCDESSKGQLWARRLASGLLEDSLGHCIQVSADEAGVRMEACREGGGQQWDFKELEQPVGVYDPWTPAPSLAAVEQSVQPHPPASQWAVEASGQWEGEHPTQAMGRRRRRSWINGLQPILDVPSA